METQDSATQQLSKVQELQVGSTQEGVSKRMTQEELDLLTTLSNPALAKRAEMERNRPMDRSPLRHFRADILGKGSDLQVTQRTPQGSQYPQTGVWLDINVTEVYDSGAHAMPTGNMQLWVRLPNPSRTGGHNPNVNSEAVQMVQSAGLNSIRDLPGKKNVEFKDEVHTYMGRYDTQEPEYDKNGHPTGRTVWADRENSTWYYKLTIGKGVNQSNGAAPATSEGIDAALNLLFQDSVEAEVATASSNTFQVAASKDSVVNKDVSLVKSIAEGKFVADMVAAGKILREGEKLVRIGLTPAS